MCTSEMRKEMREGEGVGPATRGCSSSGRQETPGSCRRKHQPRAKGGGPRGAATQTDQLQDNRGIDLGGGDRFSRETEHICEYVLYIEV